ncbi:PA4780 family RIO1-like protein kinase [Marinomonas sp. 2405UD68-3]|uniref:PA4780 family RIO1-like protein kinase n=1 Tax=Marinomonas sp. 2405UD68-3 TaxID=3391835 RepID=UPI0039C99A74
MKVPNRIQPLIEDGLIDEVISRLMSGKEATVYVVRCGDKIRCAKVYKDAAQRSFKNAVQYQEGRKVRNSRRSRAMEKNSKYGREQQETAWHNTEVDALKKLSEAGVRVPETFGCIDGVLLMELITDESGDVAPRLNDVSMSKEQAIEDHLVMMHYIVRMLCTGLIHGDLSEFNVLVDEYGPVIIDLPQVVDAAGNNNAEWMLSRDVDKITEYYARFAPELSKTKYAKEMWALYESGELTPDSQLEGVFVEDDAEANVDSVLAEIQAAIAEEEERLKRIQVANEED